jgi:hypothetical protein
MITNDEPKKTGLVIKPKNYIEPLPEDLVEIVISKQKASKEMDAEALKEADLGGGS